MKALFQNGPSTHGTSRFLIKGIMSTVRVWPDDFRDGDDNITGFHERSQTGGRISHIFTPFSEPIPFMLELKVETVANWSATVPHNIKAIRKAKRILLLKRELRIFLSEPAC
jgi:hypothetical protein